MNYSLSKISRDDVLAAVGLQTRRTAADMVLPALGLFGVGVLLGAGLGVLFAPKSGAQTREAIGHGVGGVARRMKARISRKGEELADLDLDGLAEITDDDDATPVTAAPRNGSSRPTTTGATPSAPKV